MAEAEGPLPVRQDDQVSANWINRAGVGGDRRRRCWKTTQLFCEVGSDFYDIPPASEAFEVELEYEEMQQRKKKRSVHRVI